MIPPIRGDTMDSACLHSPSKQQTTEGRLQGEHGVAMLIMIVALSIISLLSLYVCLNATVELRISDNFETKIRANQAALAGISHARIVLQGLDFNDLLVGPDGICSSAPE